LFNNRKKMCSNSNDNVVDLGFAEKYEEDFQLTSIGYPSKLGGKPVWLRWDKLLTEKQVHCENCDKIMQFLCQIYVPTELNGIQYHRTIFLFCCSDGKCYASTKNCSIKVFRSLLEEENDNFTEEDLDRKVEEELRKAFDSKQSLWQVCEVCSLNGDKKCSNCRNVHYCSKEHQLYDWKVNKHKKYCKKNLDGKQKCYVLVSIPLIFFGI